MNYGIRVKNPLPKVVRVEVIDGKRIIGQAILDPGTTSLIPLDQPGKYEVRSTIMEEKGGFPGQLYEELGPATWKVIDHQDVTPAPWKPVFFNNSIQTNGGYWKTVIRWDIPRGGLGELLSVEIEKLEGVDWRVKMGHWLDARQPKGKIEPIPQTTTFNNCSLGGGEAVILQARSRGMTTTVSGRISGMQTVTDETKVPVGMEPISDDEEEEVPVTSLADIFEHMKKSEVKV